LVFSVALCGSRDKNEMDSECVEPIGGHSAVED
jgi:hypothetical protein